MPRKRKEVHNPSPTAVAAEALRTGVVPQPKMPVPPVEIPKEGEVLLVGDPDDSALNNAYVGDETPGGSTPTPDQDRVDDIGRAYGVQEADSGALRATAEILDARDRHRALLEVPDTKK
ncbi:MAG TPA: DUF6335 family protein [Vicinamibacteria bacterium]|jgi:hypothetical protein